MTRGYFGAVFDGRYIYYAPCRTREFHGVALRYDTQAPFADLGSWEAYDAGATGGLDTRGYAGAVFDGRYVYYVPFSVEDTRHARVLRYDTQAPFGEAASWAAYDAQVAGRPPNLGYDGAIYDGSRYVYFVPFGYAPLAHGKVLRLDTQGDFGAAESWTLHNAGATGGLDTRGYYGAAFDGRHVYFVPFNDGEAFHGRVLRYDTEGGFEDEASWEARDASQTGGLSTIGYKGAVYVEPYVYYVPFRDAEQRHGRVLRFDTRLGFGDDAAWSVFDAGNTDGVDTRGFVGGETDGRYVYFVPYSGDDNVYHGRTLRYDTQGAFESPESWDAFDVDGTGGMATVGYKYAATDGRWIYFTPYSNNSMFHGIALRYDTGGDPAEGEGEAEGER